MASETVSALVRAAVRSPVVWWPLRLVERIVFGGVTRESILVKLLLALQDSKLRRAWRWTGAYPHFSDHRVTWLKAGLGTQPGGVLGFIRGFHVVEILRSDDVVLDIGCGDGFFTRRFYAPSCARVDAIDVDATAIRTAILWNKGENVSYHNMDVCKEPFPRTNYDVVVCDGAIGHLPQGCAGALLSRIAGVLGENGVFCGSESLGGRGARPFAVFRLPRCSSGTIAALLRICADEGSGVSNRRQ
jgi:SAM-dependent methyltransferase